MRIEEIEIDLYQSAYFVIPLKQRDTTMLRIIVLAHAEPYEVGNVILKAVHGEDDITQRSNISVNGNVVEALLDEFIVRDSGDVKFELIFLKNNVRVSTYLFDGDVEPTQYNFNMPLPDDVYVRPISVNDWVLQNDGTYIISIPQELHNLSTTAYVAIAERYDTDYKPVICYYMRDMSGTLIVMTEIPYAGRVVLRR